jgi:hypothetical protein
MHRKARCGTEGYDLYRPVRDCSGGIIHSGAQTVFNEELICGLLTRVKPWLATVPEAEERGINLFFKAEHI